MNLSAPTKGVFFVSLILAALALVGMFVTIPFVSANVAWVAIIAYIVLLIGNVAKGL